MPLFLILVIVPIIEIALFISVGGAIGVFPTLAIVVLTAVIGTILLRGQGLATLANLQNSVGRGENPMGHMAHGAMILVAGVVLLTPGFFTDAVGFLLLVPAVRSMLISRFSDAVKGNVHVHGADMGWSQDAKPTPQSQSGDIYEAEFEILDEDAPRGDSGWTQSPNDKT